MTEQQEHLTNLIKQRQTLSHEVTEKRELLLKIQGAIEYLTQVGVTLPEPDSTDAIEKTEETEKPED